MFIFHDQSRNSFLHIQDSIWNSVHSIASSTYAEKLTNQTIIEAAVVLSIISNDWSGWLITAQGALNSDLKKNYYYYFQEFRLVRDLDNFGVSADLKWKVSHVQTGLVCPIFFKSEILTKGTNLMPSWCCYGFPFETRNGILSRASGLNSSRFTLDSILIPWTTLNYAK